jgi:Aspartyl protease
MLRSYSFRIGPLVALAWSSSCVAQQTTVPFQLQDNLIRVPIRLNGQPVEAVLDSGTGGLGIDRSFAASVGLHMGASIGMVPGGGAPEPMYPVTIDGLDFGPEHMENVSAIAMSLGSLSSSAGSPVRASRASRLR